MSASSSNMVSLEVVHDDLLDLIKREMTGEEQELFVRGFYAYLQHDSRKDFVVNLEDVYSWLGFSRKDNAKTVVRKKLQEGSDYRILPLSSQEQNRGGQAVDNIVLHRTQEQKQDGRGGSNKENVMLTVHGFKQLCMQSNTEKARRVLTYYLSMEEIMWKRSGSSTSVSLAAECNYGYALLDRLKSAFTTTQQHMFVESFWTFLQCDEEVDMVVDLDEACKYIGVRKDQAKRTLLKSFREGQNYSVLAPQNVIPQIVENSPEGQNFGALTPPQKLFAPQIVEQRSSRGGHNVERIMMTPDTFKELCMMSNTAKAREARGYYIKMEKVLKQYLKEQAESLQRQLVLRSASEARLIEEKSTIAAEKAQIEAEKVEAEKRLALELGKQKQRAYVPVPKLDNVYVMKEAAELHSDRHKIGKALDTKKRTSSFNTGSARGVQMLHVRETHNAPIVENVIEVTMKRYHFQREHYMCNIEHSVNTVDAIATVIDTLASCADNITRADMLRKIKENLDHVLGEDEEAKNENEDEDDTDSDQEHQDENGPNEESSDANPIIERQTDGVTEPNNMSKLHVCPRCGYTTSARSHYGTHIFRARTCKDFLNSGKSIDDLRENWNRENDAKVSCPDCGVMYTSRGMKFYHQTHCPARR